MPLGSVKYCICPGDLFFGEGAVLGLPLRYRGKSRLDDCGVVTNKGIAVASRSSGNRSVLLLLRWLLWLFHHRHIVTLHDIGCMSITITRPLPGCALAPIANELPVAQRRGWLPARGPLSGLAMSRRNVGATRRWHEGGFDLPYWFSSEADWLGRREVVGRTIGG